MISENNFQGPTRSQKVSQCLSFTKSFKHFVFKFENGHKLLRNKEIMISSQDSLVQKDLIHTPQHISDSPSKIGRRHGRSNDYFAQCSAANIKFVSCAVSPNGQREHGVLQSTEEPVSRTTPASTNSARRISQFGGQAQDYLNMRLMNNNGQTIAKKKQPHIAQNHFPEGFFGQNSQQAQNSQVTVARRQLCQRGLQTLSKSSKFHSPDQTKPVCANHAITNQSLIEIGQGQASSRRALQFNEDAAIDAIRSPKPNSREQEAFNQLGYSQSYQRLREKSMASSQATESPARHQSHGRFSHARNQSHNIVIADSNQNSADLRREAHQLGITNSIINYRHANDQQAVNLPRNEPSRERERSSGGQILPQLQPRDGSSSHRYTRSSVGATLLPSYQVSIGKVPFTGSDVAMKRSTIPVQQSQPASRQGSNFRLNRRTMQSMDYNIQQTSSRNQSRNRLNWQGSQQEQSSMANDSHQWSIENMKVHAAKMKSFDNKNYSLSTQLNGQERINRGEMAAKLAKLVVHQKQTTRNGTDQCSQLFKGEIQREGSRGCIEAGQSLSAQGITLEEKKGANVFQKRKRSFKKATETKRPLIDFDQLASESSKQQMEQDESKLSLPKISQKVQVVQQTPAAFASSQNTITTDGDTATPKRNFNSMRHQRKSTFLNKVMLKKKISTPDVAENASATEPRKVEGETTPSSGFIEKIKNLQPDSTFGRSSVQDLSDNQSQLSQNDFKDYINSSIRPGLEAQGSRSCTATQADFNPNQCFLAVCAESQRADSKSYLVTDPDQAYGAIQTSNPTNTLDTPVKKPIDKEQGLAKQNSNFEIETPCFKAPVMNIGGISMYSNLPKQPSIEKASRFNHEDIPSILPGKRQSDVLGDHLINRIEESIDTDDTSLHQTFYNASQSRHLTCSNTSQPSCFTKNVANPNIFQSKECIFESTDDVPSYQGQMPGFKINDFQQVSARNQMSEGKYTSGKKITFGSHQKDKEDSHQKVAFHSMLKCHQSTSNLAFRLPDHFD